jgi:N-acetylneuraminic acid mutarotase
VKRPDYSGYFSILAMSVALVLGSASCNDATDAESSPADGGAHDGGASGAQTAGTGPAGSASGDGGSGGEAKPVRVRISGSAQKGPMIDGSSVTVFGLDSTLEATGTSFPSQTEDNLGSFAVSGNLTEEFIEVVAQGAFYDELTGRPSETSIVLRALAAVSPDTDIRVNLLTTASKKRIRYLVGQGRQFDDAVAQAEKEVLRAFGIENELAAFTDMDITGSTASDAALIALSAILLQYGADHSASEGEKVAQLGLAVSSLASDLEEDGTLNGDALGIATAAARLDVPAVSANLAEIYARLGLSLSVPHIEPFVATVANRAPWRFATPMPVARYGHCACAVDDKIYVMGGSQGASPPVSDVFQYDPATGHSEPKAQMPMVRAYTSCSVVDGVIYVLGGYMDYLGPGDAVDAYAPAQDAWTTKSPLPFGRSGHASTTVNGKIYVMGGWQRSESARTDSVMVYDPARDAWESLSPLPTPLAHLTSATVSGSIYTFGGDSAAGPSSAVYQYDPLADTWMPRASMPTASADATAVALGGRIYVMGGSRGSDSPGRVDEYDPSTDSWTTKTLMNVSRYSPTGVVSGDLAYVIGGLVAGAGQTPSPVVETYDPTKDHP